MLELLQLALCVYTICPTCLCWSGLNLRSEFEFYSTDLVNSSACEADRAGTFPSLGLEFAFLILKKNLLCIELQFEI